MQSERPCILVEFRLNGPSRVLLHTDQLPQIMRKIPTDLPLPAGHICNLLARLVSIPPANTTADFVATLPRNLGRTTLQSSVPRRCTNKIPEAQPQQARADYSGHEDVGTGPLGVLGNIIWLVFAGWWLALGHIIVAVFLAVTIIGIPFAWAHLKLAGIALWPIGKTIVPADEAAFSLCAAKLIPLTGLAMKQFS